MPESVVPAISVIMTAHDRRDYIINALTSLKNQTLDSRYFEVIVVKNFNDLSIDEYILKLGYKNILCTDAPVGSKLYSGLLQATGNIISFLEDDDLFDSNKLQTVLKMFTDEPDLYFHRNSAIFIDKFGKQLQNIPISDHSGVEFYTWPFDFERDGIQSFPDHILTHNVSLMSLRADSIREKLQHLQKIIMSPDIFMFFASLDSGKKLAIDSRMLTSIRRHGGEWSMMIGSFGTINAKRKAVIIQSLKDKEIISQALSDQFARDLFWKIYYWMKIEVILRGGKTDRKNFFRLGTNYFKDRYQLFHVIPPFFALIFSLYFISPKITVWLYETFEWIRYTFHGKVFGLNR